MKHYITIALCIFLSQMCTGQVMMLFSQDSLTGIVSPLDVDSLFYWFAADVGVTDSLGGAIATDEGVGQWNDLSGNGHHVTQSTNGARPVWKATGGPGSKPCIQFDGTDDFLASAAHWWGSDDLTIIIVYKHANATANLNEYVVAKIETISPANTRQFGFAGRSTAEDYVIGVEGSDDGTSGTGENWSYRYDAKSASYRVICFTDTNASRTTGKSVYIDGASHTLNTTRSIQQKDGINDSAAIKLGIGAVNVTSGNPSNFLLGSISEIIVFSSALSSTERTAIENYLNRKYDLY